MNYRFWIIVCYAPIPADKELRPPSKGVLGKLAEKIAGEAGKAIGENVVDGAKDILGPAAGQTTDFLISLFKGDGDTVARIAVSKTIV